MLDLDGLADHMKHLHDHCELETLVNADVLLDNCFSRLDELYQLALVPDRVLSLIELLLMERLQEAYDKIRVLKRWVPLDLRAQELNRTLKLFTLLRESQAALSLVEAILKELLN